MNHKPWDTDESRASGREWINILVLFVMALVGGVLLIVSSVPPDTWDRLEHYVPVRLETLRDMLEGARESNELSPLDGSCSTPIAPESPPGR